MKKVLIIILLLNQVIFKSQITLNWSVNVDDNTVHLILTNNSKDKVALPINLENLQAYFSDHCLIREPDFNRNYLNFSPAIVRCSEGNKIQPVIYPSVPYIDTEEFEITKLQIDKEEREYIQKISSWKKINKIKDTKQAEINHYIMDHLVYFDPREVKHFRINSKSRRSEKILYIITDNYVIEMNESDTFFLEICIDEKNYNYLTPFQLKKLRKYKLISGNIRSNVIQIKLDN